MSKNRLIAAAAVAALGAGLAVAALSPAQASGKMAWGACPGEADPRQQCATLPVPLDYRAPRGRTIELTVSRISAAKPERRKGVLLVNGGGPGPSLDVPSALAGLLPADVTDSYDLVGFDPRGIAHSTPMNCGRDADELVRDEELEVLSFPAGDGSIARNVAFSRRMAAQCAANSGDLLPHLTTANVARDMDRLRQALGERTVSYYGISWGTYLGSIYRALFPRTVDRMVLDSSVDPDKRGYEDFLAFGGAMEDRWPDLARFAVANQDVVRLGGTAREVRRNYLALAAKLDRKPVTLARTKAKMSGNLLRMFTWQLSYNDASMIATPQAPVPALAQLWRAAGNLAAGRATAEDRAFVEGFANHFVEQGVLPGIAPDNLFSVGWAISCGDRAWPRDVRTYARNVAADRATHPLTAGAPANIAPCSAWKVQPVEAEPKVTSTGTRNVLILQNRRDPSTPLRTAQGMRRALGPDAALVDIDAGGHGVVVHPTPNTCAISTMDAFLTTGALPAGDRSCA